MSSRKINEFLSSEYTEGSFYAVLKKWLLRKYKGGISPHTLARIYYNLQPIGRELDNPPLADLSREWLASYVKKCWLTLAPETMRTKVGDLREFFRWCRKKRLTKTNLAKAIAPVKQKASRYRRARSAEESEIKTTIAYLVEELDGLVCRDSYGELYTADFPWTYYQQQALRDLFILVFLYETGCRVGELANLGSAAIAAAIKSRTAAYTITVLGKTEDRDYYFTTHTAELWQCWQEVRPDDCRQYAVIGWGKGHEAGRLLGNGISQILKRRSGEAGVRPFRGQALRHAKARRGKRLVGLEVTSKLLDHSSTRTTARYGVEGDNDTIHQAAIKTGLQGDLFPTHRPQR
jgi:integrase